MADNARLYEWLGVSKTVSRDDLEKAFRKAYSENRPEKGGDREKFKKLVKAYVVLSDPEKREIYDQYGDDALEEGPIEMRSGDNLFDIIQSILQSLNGRGGGSSRRLRQRRGDDVTHPLEVSLEDLYIGTSKKYSVSRNVICSKCEGEGLKSGASLTCLACHGYGMKVSLRHLGPSIIQDMYPCNECKSTGETIKDKDRCPQCKGKKVVEEKKVLEVIVKKGMQNGQKITFPGETDEAPGSVTGNLMFVLQQKEHPKFKRKGDDLFVEHNLSLTEALCGFRLILTHLDNRQLLIKSNPGEVVKPDSFKAIDDAGMPIYQTPLRGKLYIHFTVEFPDPLSMEQCRALVGVLPLRTSMQLTDMMVEFPDSLSMEQCRALEAVLPPRTSMQPTDMELDECEETTLHDVDIEEMRRKLAQVQEARGL